MKRPRTLRHIQIIKVWFSSRGYENKTRMRLFSYATVWILILVTGITNKNSGAVKYCALSLLMVSIAIVWLKFMGLFYDKPILYSFILNIV